MSARTVRAGELTLAEVGRTVRLRTLNANATGTLTDVWFKDAIGKSIAKKVRVSVSIPSEDRRSAGEIKVEFEGTDTIDVLEDEEMDA